jgi:tetratricopeptide (TPR) repeat protein
MRWIVTQRGSTWFALTGAVLLSSLSSTLLAAIDYRQSGDDHFYNLEYDQAIADYTKLIQQNPDDPIPYNDLASAHLNKEFFRLGLLDSSAVNRDNSFLRNRKAQADPRVKEVFFEMLERGRRKAETVLARNPRNAPALYSLCTDFGLRATYEFMLEKAWFTALRDGSKAHSYCDQAQKSDPGFTDAYLVLGVYEYTAGSLPRAVKLLSMGGLRGSKKKGIEYVNRVAQQGKYDREAARVLLAVLYRRESNPLEAARVLQSLITDHPRNYLFWLELASMYSDAGQPERALGTLKALLQKMDQNDVSYRVLPREAVQQKIALIERQRPAARRNATT